MRRAASLLAQGQPAEYCFELAAAASTAVETEVIACWVLELLIRGASVSSSDAIVTFWSGLRANGHPLGHLPLERLAIEDSLYRLLWRDTARVASSDEARPLPDELSYQEGPSLVPCFALERLPTPTDLCAAPENWLDESNGHADGGLFRIDEEVRELRRAHLEKLPLECISSARSLEVALITAAAAAAKLFSAAATGGAYNMGRHAAYGRRDMWRSLAALVGANASDSLAAIEQKAHACRFYSLSIDSDWMYDVAWDLALACLREDRQTFAIVLASDTD